MQFSAKNQKSLAVDDELGRIPASFKMGQFSMGIASLSNRWSGRWHGGSDRDEEGE